MRLRTPNAPTERGIHGDRPYWLWEPEAPGPTPGMVIVHGAGSSKESHADFGRACAARGWTAVSFDQAGHGASEDVLTPGALADVGRMAAFLAARDGVDADRICVRGSSWGGYLAIHAAATDARVAGVIAICPASEDGLRRGLHDDALDLRGDIPALDAWLAEHDLRDAVAQIPPKPLILLHAEGDERVPYTWSQELHERAGDPTRLILLPGGHHRSVQHDPELQAVALAWIEKRLGL